MTLKVKHEDYVFIHILYDPLALAGSEPRNLDRETQFSQYVSVKRNAAHVQMIMTALIRVPKPLFINTH